MLRTDRLAIYILLAGMVCMIPSMTLLSVADELTAFALLAVAVADIIMNRGAWRRYTLLLIAVGAMAFYIVYSMTAVHYNTRGAILADAIIELKPYLALLVIAGIRPQLTGADRTLFKAVAVINIVICAIILPMPKQIVDAILDYIAYGGIYIFVCTLVYIYCSLDSDGHLSSRDKVTAVLLCTFGLLCGRSKFYGEYIFLLFFLFLYRPGMISRAGVKQIAAIGGLIIVVAIVVWKKFSFYFLGGATITTYDPDTIAGFARPVLYGTGALIMADRIPFGSGLASFASAKSAEPYSGIYAEYGIDKVFGLSEANSTFVCDAYYPTLAQFGIAGLALFIALWTFVIRRVGLLVRTDPQRYRMTFAVAMLCVLFFLVEATGGTTVTTMGGVISMGLLGIITGRADALHDECEKSKQQSENFTSPAI